MNPLTKLFSRKLAVTVATILTVAERRVSSRKTIRG